jgi:glycosyltransferase involved in cell wall biosynthesis
MTADAPSDGVTPENRSASSHEPLSITAIILTRDEEIHLERCIASIRALVARIVVIDSVSTDRTLEIAKRLGAETLQHAFRNHADQFQWGVDAAAPTTDWILRIDADEYFEPALCVELRASLPTLEPEVTGFSLRRKVIFRDTWIRHGGYYPTFLLRLWRNGCGRIEQRWMDEHIVLTRGTARKSRADFVDHNLAGLTHWTDKHNRYTTRQMVDFLNLEYGFFPMDAAIDREAGSQARLKRFLRNQIFARAPLYVRGLLYFFQRYFLRLGFLDGRDGFVFHFLQGLWNWILIDAKIDEARAYIAAHGIEAFKTRLATHYGIELTPEPRDGA